jgi:two-component system LytT family sensor kinase
LKTEKNILLKSIPFILAILLPSIDYFNNTTNGNNIDSLIRWIVISLTLLAIWYLNIFISKSTPIYIFIINLVFIGIISLILIKLNLNTINTTFFPRIILPAILFVAIQQSFKAIQDRKTLITENLILKSETYKAELENLRNQINPHFLFNSLTTLQTLIRQNPVKAEDYLIKLSDFYRRSLLSTYENKILLQEELEFIDSYFFLLESRFENGLKIKVEIFENSKQYNLPIFAMQLLIENCIKHNIVSDEKPLKIHIFQDDVTSITIKNNVQPKLKNEKSTRTGLSNLAKRYELLGIKNGLIIDKSETQFSVTLKLF